MTSKKNYTLVKPPEDSSMTHEECEDMSFLVSKLEDLVKGFVSKRDLEKSRNNLKGDLEKSREGLVKTLDLANLQTQMDERMGYM